MFIKPDSPFYKNPVLWLVILLPLTTVVVGIVFLIYSIRYDDGDVIDDYYKKGKQINLTLERDEVAADNQLSALIVLDQSRKLLTLTLQAKDGFIYPDDLSLAFIHRTVADKDVELKLIRQQLNQYFAVLPEIPASRWHVELGTVNWRLKGHSDLPGTSEIKLTARSYSE